MSTIQDFINRSKKPPTVQTNTQNKTQGHGNTQFWRMHADQNGNSVGTYVIRFLPAKPSDTEYQNLCGVSSKSPKIEHIYTYFAYRFDNIVNGKKRYYNERSLDTLQYGTDPVGAFNQAMFKLGKQDKRRNMKTVHVANILVVKDPYDQSNEGKNFLFEFSRDIFQQLLESIAGNPEVDIDPINPFDIISGYNMIITFTAEPTTKIRRYKVAFSKKPETILNGDEERIGKLIDSLYSLDEYASPSNYKPAHELLEKLNYVIGYDSSEYLSNLGVTGIKPNITSTAAVVSAVEQVANQPQVVVPTTVAAHKAEKATSASIDDDFDDIPF